MRTSNKILLSIFIAVVLIITGIHVALYAKIKSGDLVTFHIYAQPGDLEKHAIPAIKHVRITGMEECRINYSDSGHLELSKKWKGELTWKIDGDSLIIEGPANTNYSMGTRVYLPVDLYLPADVIVHARYSQLYVRGADDSAKAFSRAINTEYSHVFIYPNSRGDKPVYWKKLQVTSRDGGINVSRYAEIAEMEVDLLPNVAFTDEGAHFGSLSVKIDRSSTISLRQGSLEKIKLIKP
jgi:hypothetical protein